MGRRAVASGLLLLMAAAAFMAGVAAPAAWAGPTATAVAAAPAAQRSPAVRPHSTALGYTAFVLDSTTDYVGEGQQLTFTPSNATITAYADATGDVVFSVAALGHSFQAVLAAPTGQSLALGTYTGVQRLASATQPRLDISGDGRGCNVTSGQFTVLDISYDSYGNLATFAADAQMGCDGYGPLFASFRLASTVGYAAVAWRPAPALPLGFTLPFATEPLGTTSPAVPVVLTNVGVVPLSVSSQISGIYGADFQIVASTCRDLGPLAPGASCSLSITFTPHALGERDASLVTAVGTPRGTYVLALTGIGTAPPTFTYPTAGQSNVDTTKAFTWTASPGAQANRFVVGTTPGADNLVDSYAISASETSYPVPALPTGTTLYATVSAETNGTWTLRQTVAFTAMAQVAAFTSPLQGALAADPTQPITWTTDSQDQAYYLVVGTTPGSANLINSGVLPATQSSYAPPPMPGGTMLYATLLTEWVGGWSHSQSISFFYQSGKATFTSPLNGARVATNGTMFTWSTVPQAQAYYLVVNTAHATLVNSGSLPPSRWYAPAVALPAGVAIYATIFTELGGAWSYQTITFTAGATAT